MTRAKAQAITDVAAPDELDDDPDTYPQDITVWVRQDPDDRLGVG